MVNTPGAVKEQPVGGGAAERGERGAPGDLVRCTHCGLHLPRAEAHAAGGRLYCSEEHARLGPEGE